MKQCCKCKQEKPLTDFNKKSANRDGLERYCKECHRAKNRKHYEANKAKYVAQSIAYGKQYKDWYKDLKKDLRCERCGEDHPATIEFHHLDPTEKENSVSQMIVSRLSKETILAEMAKCIVLCSNCHRKEHYEQNIN
jgi:hypothetical protein